jgi:hypothetical protein
VNGGDKAARPFVPKGEMMMQAKPRILKQALASLSISLAMLGHTPVCGRQSETGADRSSEVPGISKADFILTRVDVNVVAEFKKAWRAAGGGADATEAVVLLYKQADGSLIAWFLPLTFEHKQFTFKWHPGIVGVVHTHPSSTGSRPQGEDLRIANKYNVPVFTITAGGMYMYDPDTRKISRVMTGLDWLEVSKWDKNSRLASKR